MELRTALGDAARLRPRLTAPPPPPPPPLLAVTDSWPAVPAGGGGDDDDSAGAAAVVIGAVATMAGTACDAVADGGSGGSNATVSASDAALTDGWETPLAPEMAADDGSEDGALRLCAAALTWLQPVAVRFFGVPSREGRCTWSSLILLLALIASWPVLKRAMWLIW